MKQNTALIRSGQSMLHATLLEHGGGQFSGDQLFHDRFRTSKPLAWSMNHSRQVMLELAMPSVEIVAYVSWMIELPPSQQMNVLRDVFRIWPLALLQHTASAIVSFPSFLLQSFAMRHFCLLLHETEKWLIIVTNLGVQCVPSVTQGTSLSTCFQIPTNKSFVADRTNLQHPQVMQYTRSCQRIIIDVQSVFTPLSSLLWRKLLLGRTDQDHGPLFQQKPGQSCQSDFIRCIDSPTSPNQLY